MNNLVDIFQLRSFSLADSTAKTEVTPIQTKPLTKQEALSPNSISIDLQTSAISPTVSTSVSRDIGECTDDGSAIDYADLAKTEEFELNDCRLAMIGNVDSGKSTLIGVLMSHSLDDGRGLARSLVLKHRSVPFL